ncbi:hypothetical protein C4565_03650 [Candidatus Parcubacteria bacterium]|nr:MAG: hypothetical protein C4565_03650 [Candidatus Parcubacteria bacterium]
MKQAIATLKSKSPYSQSKHYVLEKLEKESAKDYEARTWKNRCHYSEAGNVIIPPMQFKKTIEDAAAFLSMKIEGKGKQTYSKHFLAGILVTDGIELNITMDTLQGEWLFVPSDGRRGGGSRVDKCFPLIPKWEGDVTYYILDETITQSVFRKHLEEAGNFIGIGRFRPRVGGFYGRFDVKDLKWQEV